jgi:DNA-binding GntR family transcriptional regulator
MGRAFELDSQFHLAIAKACGNPYVHGIMQRLDARIQLSRLVRCGTMEHVRGAIAQHARLVDSFRSHDAEQASSLMMAHVMLMAPGT